MKQVGKNFIILIIGIGLTYMGATSIIKDSTTPHIIVGDSTEDFTYYYLVIGILLIIASVVFFVREYKRGKEERY